MLEQFNLSPLVAVVDIETNGKNIDAQILTVGCVLVDIVDGAIIDEFYQRVEMDSQPGRTSSFDTIQWWIEVNKSSPTAYSQAFSQDLPRYPLKLVLAEFDRFLSVHFGTHKRQVMGNGPEFDNAILDHAYQQCGLKPAWHYGGNQSLRTAVWMGRMLLGIDPKYGEMEWVKHHALDDARHEANYLLRIISAFKEKVAA